MARNLSELHRTWIQVMAIGVCWLWMNHILACLWYAIGRYAPSDTGVRWVERTIRFELEEVPYENMHHVFQYATAIHWSIAQTTLGAMEVEPVNTHERIFNVGCLVIGLFFGSSLISSLSARMVEFRMSMQLRSHTMSTLRRYLLENNVDKKVALVAVRQAAARLNDTGVLAAKDVPALATLATGVRHKLHCEICQPHLQKHQLFQMWQHIDSQWFQEFCSKAVEMKILRPDDDLFLPGTESAATYFVISGTMEYTQVPESSPVVKMTQSTVEQGSRLCESTLWVHWIHVGKAEAMTRCQVLAIQVEGFTLAMHEHYTVGAIATDYGRVFAERVVSSRPPHFPWPDDLMVPFTEYGDVVVALPPQLHVLIGSVALDHCKSSRMRLWHNTQAHNDLRQEVEDGRSIVILSHAGEMERVVALVVMHIDRGDGRVFVQLAKWENSQVVPDMQLPAAKCRRNESSDEAFQRLLVTKLAMMAEGIEVMRVERESAKQHSARFGMCTHYMRKVFFARFSGALCETPCQEVAALMSSSSKRLSSSQQVDRSASASWVKDIFDNLPVHFIEHDVGGVFYAWLRESDVQQLNMLKQNALVRRWLSTLLPPLSYLAQHVETFEAEPCHI